VAAARNAADFSMLRRYSEEAPAPDSAAKLNEATQAKAISIRDLSAPEGVKQNIGASKFLDSLRKFRAWLTLMTRN